MAASTPYMILILLSGLVSLVVFADEQCNGPRHVSIYGKTLRGHTYDKRFARSRHAECLHTCRIEKVCQSFNFVISTSECEFNNRTKEASPENFVDDPDRYYFKLDVHRVPLGSIPELPAKSCQEIKANEESQVVSGKYWFYSIIPGTSVFAYCNMTTNDIDECSASPSACTNGDCANNDGSYVCTCHPGFTGNGKSCSDIDECGSGLHDCHPKASCTNTEGSYTCACNSPFYGDGKTGCKHARGLQTSSILNGSVIASIHLYNLTSFLEPALQDSTLSRFVRCWRAASDGWAASTFHSGCDGKGPTVTIIRVGSYLFGGYTSHSWYGSCSYTSDNTAFIYSLYNIRGNDPLKLRVKSGDSSAIYSCSSYGPTFGGGHNIYISNDAASNTDGSYANCGYSYSLPAGYSCPFNGGGFAFTPTDVEVFYETTS